jgi:hypothetical protein
MGNAFPVAVGREARELTAVKGSIASTDLARAQLEELGVASVSQTDVQPWASTRPKGWPK